MKIKGVLDEDFQDYKKISMLIEMPHCSFKCLKELNLPISICQNCELSGQNDFEVTTKYLIDRFNKNSISEAIIFGGLEPFDSFDDVLSFITEFRKVSNAEIVVFTGFDEHEIHDKIHILSQFTNIVVKFGRFVPNQEHHFDDVLGVELASPNQYAKLIGSDVIENQSKS